MIPAIATVLGLWLLMVVTILLTTLLVARLLRIPRRKRPGGPTS